MEYNVEVAGDASLEGPAHRMYALVQGEIALQQNAAKERAAG